MQNLEYLVAWLDEHEDELAAPGYRRLRQATEQQLGELRQQMVPPVVKVAGAAAAPHPAPTPSAPERHARAPVTARPVEQVARDFAFAADTFDAVEEWVKAGVIRRTSADNLRRLLDAEVNRLRLERAGRAAKLGLISDLDIVEYAQRSMEVWTRSGVVAVGDRTSLVAYLESRHKELVPPLPISPATRQADVVTPIRVVPPVQPARAKPTQVVAAPKIVAARPRPAPAPRPVRPPRPPINWSQTPHPPVSPAVRMQGIA